MADLLQNLWPIHGPAWLICAVIGLILGHFLANATGSTFVNMLILLAIMGSMAFAIAQGIGTAVELRPEDFASWTSFQNFWAGEEDVAWAQNGRLWEVIYSTGIGTGVAVVTGMLTMFLQKDRA